MPQTNNRAELSAAIGVLRLVSDIKGLQLCVDSQLVTGRASKAQAPNDTRLLE